MIPKSSKMEPEREAADSSPAQGEGESSREDPSLLRRCRTQTKFYEPDQPTPKKALQIQQVPNSSSCFSFTCISGWRCPIEGDSLRFVGVIFGMTE